MTAAALAKRLINDERVSRGIKLPEAREVIAREAGVSPGSLENLGRGRLKYIDRISGRLNALLVKKIEQRISSLSHELELARAAKTSSAADLGRAEAFLAEARKALGKV
jgi:hypothetical protein